MYSAWFLIICFGCAEGGFYFQTRKSPIREIRVDLHFRLTVLRNRLKEHCIQCIELLVRLLCIMLSWCEDIDNCFCEWWLHAGCSTSMHSQAHRGLTCRRRWDDGMMVVWKIPLELTFRLLCESVSWSNTRESINLLTSDIRKFSTAQHLFLKWSVVTFLRFCCSHHTHRPWYIMYTEFHDKVSDPVDG